MSTLALEARSKPKLGPLIFLGRGGGITLFSKDTLNDTSSAVWNATVKASFNSICGGRGSYSFTKTVYCSLFDVSNKMLLAIKILLLPKFILKSSK